GRYLAEAAVRAHVAALDLRVIQHGRLLRETLDRADAIDQRPAGARRLRSVEYGGPALPRQLLGVPRRIGERRDERQGDEREPGKKQAEKRSGIQSHAGR